MEANSVIIKRAGEESKHSIEYFSGTDNLRYCFDF